MFVWKIKVCSKKSIPRSRQNVTSKFKTKKKDSISKQIDEHGKWYDPTWPRVDSRSESYGKQASCEKQKGKGGKDCKFHCTRWRNMLLRWNAERQFKERPFNQIMAAGYPGVVREKPHAVPWTLLGSCVEAAGHERTAIKNVDPDKPRGRLALNRISLEREARLVARLLE